jgi:hypothetical protein
MRLRLDRFELGLLALMGALSLWIVGSDLVIAHGRSLVWTRTDSFFPVDQLQYLAWIQSSARHGLISDLFVLRRTPADYLQPAIMLSGLLVRLGMAAWLALLLWKPVAVIAIVLAARALSARCFQERFERRAALVLALLYASLSDVNHSLGVIGDMMTMWQSWGYPFGLIAAALITFGLLRYARARLAGVVAWSPGLLGALAGSIHPWQGELMLLIVLIAELCRGRETLARVRRERTRRGGRGGGRARPVGALLRDPAIGLGVVTLGLVAIPLLYYFGLGHLDAVWRMGQARARHSFSTTAVLIAAAPLLAVALLGYRGRPADFLELLLRAWVPAAVVIWIFSASGLGATPLHAVGGLPLPLAVLAVRGVHRAGLDRLPRARVIACVAIALATMPGTVYTIAYAHTFIEPAPDNADFVTHGASRALGYLRADRTAGGVLSAFDLGQAITGRRDYVGDCLGSQPRCDVRKAQTVALLAGRMGRRRARQFVRGSGARFLLGGCGSARAALTRQLAGLLLATRRFGCATVWVLRPAGDGAPAAAGP